MKIAGLAALVAAAGLVTPALAHEVRPAYLELREMPSGELDVLWKTPMRWATCGSRSRRCSRARARS